MPCASLHSDPWLDLSVIVLAAWAVLVRAVRCTGILPAQQLQGHTDQVNSVAFSPDGNQIVSGSDDRSVRVWDAKTGEQLMELQGHINRVISVAFSPKGNQIVSGSWDERVWVWDAKTGEQLRELQGHTGNVNSVAFSPDGNKIVSSSWDKSV